MDCNCPEPTTLTAIVAELCGVDLKQIQRLGFQRVGDVFDVGGLPTPFDIKELSAWQAKMTAVDSTKIVVTPLIGGDPIVEAGEAITNGGGDNSTLNGVEEIEGTNPSVFSCLFKSLSSKVEREIKALTCEKSLVVYFFLQGGAIAALEVTPGTPDVYEGIPVSGQPFLSDRNVAGFGTKDTFNFRFSLPAGYSDKLVKIQPNFNPLTEL